MRIHFPILAACAALVLAALSLPAQASQRPVAASAALSTSPIQHIIVLMQENHSFDSELGNWCNQTGRCPGEPATVTLADGTVVTPKVAANKVVDITHNLAAQQDATKNKWDKIYGCTAAQGYACISYYPESTIPNLAALATSYAVEDRAFTAQDAASWVGHLNEFAATGDGFTGNNPGSTSGPGPGWGCDSDRTATWSATVGGTASLVPSCVPDYSLNPATYPYGGAFEKTPVAHVPTIMDEMGTAGVSWKIYSAGPGDFGYGWAGCPGFADCLDTSQDASDVPYTTFAADATSGSLPQVSFISPPIVYSQHNSTSNAAGDNWIGQIASDVMNSPDWASTALIITWDDCGCFYDPVPPPWWTVSRKAPGCRSWWCPRTQSPASWTTLIPPAREASWRSSRPRSACPLWPPRTPTPTTCPACSASVPRRGWPTR